MKMRKLNNKGFTLVELLAVVVILAVVMGIAMTSVLTSMNNSRKGSLTNSADSVARAFQTKYSESMVDNSLSNIYGDVLTNGYNFTSASTSSVIAKELDAGLNEELNLSTSTYVLGSSATSVTNGSSVANSFVAFNGKTMVVCLIAKNTGSYYVANAALASEKEVEIFDSSNGNFKVKMPTNAMYSCSIDGENSWTDNAAGGATTPTTTT